MFWPTEFRGLYRTHPKTQWIYHGKVTQRVEEEVPLKDKVIPLCFLGNRWISDGKGPKADSDHREVEIFPVAAHK